MAKFIEGKVVAKKKWTDKLFSLQVEAKVDPFEAGQFAKLALDIDGDLVSHPYSFVNAPHQNPLEFYFTLVPSGLLTTQLVKLDQGDSILISRHSSGFLSLSEVPQAKYLWLLSTGTGIGPFLSILNTEEPWQRFDRIVLVHAVRYEDDLAYREPISRLLRKYGEQFRYIPFVSRSITTFALQMRIPQSIKEGLLEAHAGIPLLPENSQVMLCGNPNMVKDTTQTLLTKGFKENKRKEKGQITMENYW